MAIEGITRSISHGFLNLKQAASIDKTINSSEISQQFETQLLQSMLKNTCIDQHFNSSATKNREILQFTPDKLSSNNMASISNTSGLVPPDDLTPFSILTKEHVTKSEKHQTDISQSIDQFVNSIWPYAVQASHLIGLDPKVLIAQAALETGWGKFIVKDADGRSSNNLFNIKAMAAQTNQSVKIKTTEYIANAPVQLAASFKTYLSVEHSLHDYISLIKNNPRYKTALANVNDPKLYIKALHDAGYATDPNYATKILSIYDGDELQQALQQHSDGLS